MFKKYKLTDYIKYSVISALLFCITVVIFIKSEKYSATWWLYVGNVLFMLGVIYFIFSFNKKKREDASTSSMIIGGHIVTVLGIILSCIFSYVLIMFMIPGLFGSGETNTTVINAPAQLDTGKTDGLIFMIFMNAIVGNVATGSFASIILPYTSKRDQTEEPAEIKYKVPR
jgi:uncharacterized membrane protein HdeD (DUF308 family)